MKRYRVHAMAGSNATDLEALLAEGTKEHDVNLRDRFASPLVSGVPRLWQAKALPQESHDAASPCRVLQQDQVSGLA
jgi:hypothetical protein